MLNNIRSPHNVEVFALFFVIALAHCLLLVQVQVHSAIINSLFVSWSFFDSSKNSFSPVIRFSSVPSFLIQLPWSVYIFEACWIATDLSSIRYSPRPYAGSFDLENDILYRFARCGPLICLVLFKQYMNPNSKFVWVCIIIFGITFDFHFISFVSFIHFFLFGNFCPWFPLCVVNFRSYLALHHCLERCNACGRMRSRPITRQ